MFGMRTQELLLILLVLVLLFGATRLPQLGSSIGQAIRNFKKGFGEDGAAADEKKKGQGGGGSLSSSSKLPEDEAHRVKES
ncbi:MAG: twin-arginine translocase TatA/TatE family subunit [Myxococcota bacterium]|nr:twin-arginine translocase TatA/TatE family subunit [Myxococcota bacterium]